MAPSATNDEHKRDPEKNAQRPASTTTTTSNDEHKKQQTKGEKNNKLATRRTEEFKEAHSPTKEKESKEEDTQSRVLLFDAPRTTTSVDDLDIGDVVKCTTRPDSSVFQGTVYTVDPVTKTLVLFESINREKNEADVRLIPSHAIEKLEVIGTDADERATVPPSLDEAKVIKREKDAYDAMEKALAELNANAPVEGQAMFDAVNRTMDSAWRENSIVVLDQVRIDPPYAPETCVSLDGNKNSLDRIKKVVAGLRKKLSKQHGLAFRPPTEDDVRRSASSAAAASSSSEQQKNSATPTTKSSSGGGGASHGTTGRISAASSPSSTRPPPGVGVLGKPQTPKVVTSPPPGVGPRAPSSAASPPPPPPSQNAAPAKISPTSPPGVAVPPPPGVPRPPRGASGPAAAARSPPPSPDDDDDKGVRTAPSSSPSSSTTTTTA